MFETDNLSGIGTFPCREHRPLLCFYLNGITPGINPAGGAPKFNLISEQERTQKRNMSRIQFFQRKNRFSLVKFQSSAIAFPLSRQPLDCTRLSIVGRARNLLVFPELFMLSHSTKLPKRTVSQHTGAGLIPATREGFPVFLCVIISRWVCLITRRRNITHNLFGSCIVRSFMGGISSCCSSSNTVAAVAKLKSCNCRTDFLCNRR